MNNDMFCPRCKRKIVSLRGRDNFTEETHACYSCRIKWCIVRVGQVYRQKHQNVKTVIHGVAQEVE